jgi:arylsulfatase A-like enzyme
VPTIAAFVGMVPSALWQGRDLLAERSPKDTRVFSRTRASLPVESVNLFAVRDGEWKLIVDQQNNEEFLFNLTEDAEETDNVLAENPDIAQALRSALAAHRQQCNALHERLAIPDHAAEPAEISDEIKQQLEDLGYMR